MIRTAGAQFKRGERHLYFIASSTDYCKEVCHLHRNLLIAVNEINSPGDELQVKAYIRNGNRVFIDSGIFNLTNEHMRNHGCRMEEALALAPDQIDGFQKLYEKFVRLCKSLGDESWGYIEMDQGGRENKIKTRARLEAEGLRPIPVYHPFNDGWDYFDFLAVNYDRICFGNIVQAEPEDRKRLIATAFLRARKYPRLWIHLLGVTPNLITYGCPPCSLDSSTWAAQMRWAQSKEQVGGASFSEHGEEMIYNRDHAYDGVRGYGRNKAVAAYKAAFEERNWRNYCQENKKRRQKSPGVVQEMV